MRIRQVNMSNDFVCDEDVRLNFCNSLIDSSYLS